MTLAWAASLAVLAIHALRSRRPCALLGAIRRARRLLIRAQLLLTGGVHSPWEGAREKRVCVCVCVRACVRAC
eukprot:13917678-Alexandrium_andersonii.AAC.1